MAPEHTNTGGPNNIMEEIEETLWKKRKTWNEMPRVGRKSSSRRLPARSLRRQHPLRRTEYKKITKQT